MTKQAERVARQDEARATLRRRLRVGSVVYVTQRHVSRSGMMRYLSLSIIRDGRHVDITPRRWTSVSTGTTDTPC
jgi:hypothetical protein